MMKWLGGLCHGRSAMSEEATTLVVQRYLDALGEDAARDRIVSDLLDRAVRRLQSFCARLLRQSYPRLLRSPLNLCPDELLGSVVERLLKALRSVRPQTVRQFFALANQHIRWELNDLARRLDEQQPVAALPDGVAAPPESSASCLSAPGRRMLEAIEQLPDDEREVFSLVRIQGLSHTEVAEVLGVATKTVQRRLNRALLLLADRLRDLSPQERLPGV
jgi:RNA polymerase sigma-70 factor (ECF subfamily)